MTVTAHSSSQARARDKTDQLSNIKSKSVFLLMGLCQANVHTVQTTWKYVSAHMQNSVCLRSMVALGLHFLITM